MSACWYCAGVMPPWASAFTTALLKTVSVCVNVHCPIVQVSHLRRILQFTRDGDGGSSWRN